MMMTWKKFKRILCIVSLMLGLMMLPNGQQIEAADVWVAHWNSEGIDVYVMDDTLSHGTSSTGRWFSISTKMVKNGRLKEVITWNYSKYQTDMWRYQTNTMERSHDTVVSPGDKVFAYGMNRIGWPYVVREFWVY
jgi:hypothetical protein